jgi:MFS transporter, YNFM family, putative membrane transport protein
MGEAAASGEAQDGAARVGAMAGFLLGSAGMFATMYSTQAILPDIGRTFDVGPAGTGLTISTVVAAVAAGVWLWGPLSDRIGRRRSIIVASALLVVPTVAAGLAPSFGVLLACRAAQGLCMPGRLVVGVPYVMEAFGPWLGGRAMGVYVSALVVGGLIGRLGIALLAALVGWRWAVGGLAVLPAAAVVVMHRSLPDVGPPARSGSRVGGVPAQLRNGVLLRIGVAGGSLFFIFVGVFSYAVFRLRKPPFEFGGTASALIFLFWVLGAVGPWAGKRAERVGWRRMALTAISCCAAGVVLTIPETLPTFALGLGLVTIAMFSGVTALQLGITAASSVDRGAASAVYFSIYYGFGAVGGYVPGLAWQAWRWDGVVGASLAAAALAGLALFSSTDTASARLRVSRRARSASA